MKKVAIYCRLSEEDKQKNSNEDSESIQNQKRMLVDYALSNDWDIYKIYSDDDYCGADRNRPAFKQLLEDAKNKCFEIILCKTQSRFTRELELVEKYIHTEFPKWGIRFIGLVDNADTDNKGNKKARQINGLVNEWYLEDLSANIRQVLIDKRKHGYFIGAFAPYGYKKDIKNKGHLIIDEEAADVVRTIFQLYISGYGKKKIAAYLNELNIPNPTAYKRLKGERFKVSMNKTSSLWRYSTISSILSNEVYIGNLVQGKYGSLSYKSKQLISKPKSEWIIVEKVHDAIIDEDMWNRVKELRNSNVRPMSSGAINIFAKKLHCHHCGYILRRIKVKGNYYYKCPTRSMSNTLCKGAFISESSLEETVLKEFNILCSKYINEEEYKKLIKKNINNSNTKKMSSNNYKLMLKDMYKDKLRGLISEEMYIELSKELQMKLEKDNELNNDESRKVIDIPLMKLNRGVVELFIDKIDVSSKENNMVPIKIYWKF